MTYKGKFRPKVPNKYRGDYTNIIYRSSWELKFMKYCDSNANILEWGSEEVIVPYRSPIDNRYHRYFPDFYIKVRESTGKIKRMIIEIKPQKQCVEPKVQKRKQRVMYIKFVNMPEIKQNGKQQKNSVKIDSGNLKYLQRMN